ncbi:MAG TPA: MFS transporter [Pseudolabrys sp.]|nr:MFS transporter [Pseudolabrys sp.]
MEPEKPPHGRRAVISVLGLAQILAWGTSFYFPAVFAEPIVKETGWSLGMVVSGTTIGLLVAGLVSPQVGRLIATRGARPVMLASPLLYAAGLAGIGLSPALPVYFASWLVLGLGMGSGLYDAVFAALGRIYGREARAPITNLTLFGGFASTICWPLSAFMIEHIGWRDACFVYAGLHLLVSLPLQAAVLPRQATQSAKQMMPDSDAARPVRRLRSEAAVVALLASVMSLTAGVGAVVVVQLLIILQARGVDYATAVALGTLFGPAQVAARLGERLFGSRYHPIWTLLVSCALMAAGLLLLSGGFGLLVVTIVLYGAGYGVSWVARGTLPLALFGPVRFPRLMGKLAFPSLVVQALAPSAGALLLERSGIGITLAVLTALALVNLLFVVVLALMCRRQFVMAT